MFAQNNKITFYFNENYPKDNCFTFFHLILSRLIMPQSKTCSNEDIESALRDIAEKHISISQAAKDLISQENPLLTGKTKDGILIRLDTPPN